MYTHMQRKISGSMLTVVNFAMLDYECFFSFCLMKILFFPYRAYTA